MKNLILTCSMVLCFSLASAQESPQKTKQSKTKTDTVYNKKGKSTTTHTRKTETTGNRTNKKGTTKKSTGTETAPQRRDSTSGTTTPR